VAKPQNRQLSLYVFTLAPDLLLLDRAVHPPELGATHASIKDRVGGQSFDSKTTVTAI